MKPLQRSDLGAEGASLPVGRQESAARTRILKVGLRLFSRKGFHGTSLRDIAAELELQPSALYAHFPSKEHVLAELLRLGHQAHQDALRAAMLEAGADPVEQIRRLVRTHARFHALYPMLAVVVNEEAHVLSAELGAESRVLREQSGLLLSEVVERGIAQGKFRPPHAAATLAAIGAIGLRIPYWYERSPGFDPDALAEVQVELALRMLGAPQIR
jgi:AcrR family transcriptional regulator